MDEKRIEMMAKDVIEMGKLIYRINHPTGMVYHLAEEEMNEMSNEDILKLDEKIKQIGDTNAKHNRSL